MRQRVHHMPGAILRILVLALAAVVPVSCRTAPAVPASAGTRPLIRFLLTFDDGPSIRRRYNPTLAILNQLATNDVQNGIKAVFFLQTGNPRGGGTPRGREIMRVMHEHGHVLALHSVSKKGHVSHTKTPTNNLPSELEDAKDVVRGITGMDPRFVCPPYGSHNAFTRAAYREAGLDLVMADITAHDGVIYGYHGSPRRRWSLRSALRSVRKTLGAGTGEEPHPVLVSFHDVNDYTARKMTEYLHILVEEARRVGLALPDKPFYDTADEVLAAVQSRYAPPGHEGTAP